MRVTITTEGGFTGRGIGGVSVEAGDDEEARDAIAAASPESWQDDYPTPGRDLVRYTLTLGSTRVSWTDGADIPADLRRLFDAVWRLR